MIKVPSCPLCKHDAKLYFKDQFRQYYQCQYCKGVFVDAGDFVSGTEEKARYETHNNDVYDPGYQNFVSPITNHILYNIDSLKQGLDYGAGPGPVITKVLRDHHYNIATYDPYFDNDKQTLNQQYDYIVCCEVMEHFHDPEYEFNFLFNLLKPKGELICMTDLFTDDLDFAKWYYKNDETHVFFYHEKSLAYIKETFGFTKLSIDKRLIVFEK